MKGICSVPTCESNVHAIVEPLMVNLQLPGAVALGSGPGYLPRSEERPGFAQNFLVLVKRLVIQKILF